MEIRNITGSLKQWCIKRNWSTKKEIHIEGSINLQPDLPSRRSKSNFIMDNISILNSYKRCE